MSAKRRTRRIGSVIQPTLLIEVGHDVVDQHVAVGKVFAGLYPDRPAAERSRDASAGHRGIATALLQELDLRRARIGGKQCRVVLARGEQHGAAIVDHGIGITAIGLRIQAEQIERQVQLETSVGSDAQIFADRHRLFLHRLVVDVVGRVAQEPGQRDRHQDRGDHNRDDVQENDARDDRLESRHAIFPLR